MDMDTGKEGDVDSFPTPEELWNDTFGAEKALNPQATKWREEFSTVPFENKNGTWSPRYYQQIAIDRALASYFQWKKTYFINLGYWDGKNCNCLSNCLEII
jgi:type I restriction enzyme R subunit